MMLYYLVVPKQRYLYAISCGTLTAKIVLNVESKAQSLVISQLK